VTTDQKTARELVQDSHREVQENLSRGEGVFDGDAAWKQLSDRMAEAVLGGKLVDDFDD
jgi:hypothetical protein